MALVEIVCRKCCRTSHTRGYSCPHCFSTDLVVTTHIDCNNYTDKNKKCVENTDKDSEEVSNS